MVNPTLDFYNNNAFEFYNSTVGLDMSEHYKKFEAHLTPKCRILDAGCGSGRDSLYFLSKGYEVEAFDASEELVNLSSKLTGLEVRCAEFEDVEIEKVFKGIWACASLLHVDKGKIGQIVEKLSGMLEPGGAFYMSFKYGDKDYVKDGREFNCYTEEMFKKFLKQIPQLSIADIYKTADVRDGRKNEYWLNIIAKKIVLGSYEFDN